MACGVSAVRSAAGSGDRAGQERENTTCVAPEEAAALTNRWKSNSSFEAELLYSVQVSRRWYVKVLLP
jgi:hypothetical protein